LPRLRQAFGAAPGRLWRIRFLFRLPKMQVHQAESHRRDEVPQVRRGRHRRTQSAARQYLLGCTNYPKCDFTSNNKPVPRSARNAAVLIWSRRRLSPVSISNARTKRRALRKRPSQRSAAKRRPKPPRAPWSAPTQNASATRLLRPLPIRTDL